MTDHQRINRTERTSLEASPTSAPALAPRGTGHRIRHAQQTTQFPRFLSAALPHYTYQDRCELRKSDAASWVVAGMAAPCLACLRAGQLNLADTCSDETQDMAARWREGIVHHLICPERCGLIPVISFQSLAGPRGRRIGGWADVERSNQAA